MRRILTFFAALLLAVPFIQTSYADAEVVIVLDDAGTTVDGELISTNPESEVYLANDIVYYMEGQGSSYGEGSADEQHSPEEAAKHAVIHINEGGTYRISGALSFGQIAVEANDTDTVELILDGVDLTCTVAPAIIFYSAYDEQDAQAVAGQEPGSIITLADGSVNTVSGSHVARIYKTGTTSKLHKYDGAVYSKVSLLIRGESEGSGKLSIIADNEGLCSEMHMCVESGVLEIQSQDDGINVNEDGVSVFIQTGGLIFINAGLGAEGDGVDSNGYMWLNGGTLISLANNGADGGIDADNPIIINGGTVIAFGARNDSVDSSSTQAYMELSYASTKQAGTIVAIFDKATETPILVFEPQRAYQSLTFSSPDLSSGNTYYVLSGGVTSGESTFGLYDTASVSYSGGLQQQHGGRGVPSHPGQGGASSASNDFTLAAGSYSFMNVTNSSNVTFSGSIENSMTEVTFTAEISDYLTTEAAPFIYGGSSVALADELIQLTVTDVPSEDYFASCLMSDGESMISSIFPSEAGDYLLTIAVVDGNSQYYGSAYWSFSVTEEAASPDTLFGDADCNGEINANDAAKILRHIVRIETLTSQGEINADVDHDGTIGAADAAKILRYVVRLIDSLDA
ncbi:MAG: carbohydrate-binding domain-containing protein [Clostridia bacterium]|nr:carbohydrate-binding domain-containing protein [Clostridia bacterium]